MNFGWKKRVGLVLSAVWLCLVALVSDDHHKISEVLGFGFMPLLVIWGIVWSVAGWRVQRPQKLANTDLEGRGERSSRTLTFIAVVAVLGFGLYAATWQFHATDNEAGGKAIPMWFGEWMMYGLVAYLVFRYVPKTPQGLAAVLASIVVVGGVNYKAYFEISEDRKALASLAKAIPLINRILSDGAVSDQEIRDANVGMFEPLILAQAAYARDLVVLTGTYQKEVSGLQPELMLTPMSLASADIRVQTREKLKLWQRATTEYKTQFDAANARGKLGIQAAQYQLPADMAGSAIKGFDKGNVQLTAYVNGLVASEREVISTISAILDLMDANPKGYVVDKGPPVALLFREEATLARYRTLISAVTAASQREEDSRARLTKAQSDRTDELMNHMKR